LKIAFSISGSNLDAPLDSRFGRCAGFLIYDLDTDQFEIISNQQNLTAAQGAGIQAAETVVRSGAQALITGHCGPKAFKVLTAAGVTVYNAAEGTMHAALNAYKSGQLLPASSADVEGHWS